MKEDVFAEENEFFCEICGKEIDDKREKEEEICKECLSSLLEKKFELEDKKWKNQ